MIESQDIQFGELFYASSGTRVKLWSGVYVPTGMQVAIKRQPLQDPEDIERLISEILFMVMLKGDDSVIKFIGFFVKNEEHENFIYIVTELSPEGDLYKFLRRRKRICRPFSEFELRDMYVRLINQLASMQRMEICHRDIKPENMLVFPDNVTQTNKVKLCDFGVSKNITKPNVDRSTITGTPYYLSPKMKDAYIEAERGRGAKKVVHNEYKSDVYSLGATFLCLACLEMSSSLSKYDDLQSAICREIDSLSYSGSIKKLLNLMLVVNEDNRPDFVELEEIVLQLWPSTALSKLSVVTTGTIQILPIPAKRLIHRTTECKPRPCSVEHFKVLSVNLRSLSSSPRSHKTKGIDRATSTPPYTDRNRAVKPHGSLTVEQLQKNVVKGLNSKLKAENIHEGIIHNLVSKLADGRFRVAIKKIP